MTIRELMEEQRKRVRSSNLAERFAAALLIPGVLLGGLLGSKLAQGLTARRMRLVFAGFLLVLGFWEVLSAWAK